MILRTQTAIYWPFLTLYVGIAIGHSVLSIRLIRRTVSGAKQVTVKNFLFFGCATLSWHLDAHRVLCTSHIRIPTHFIWHVSIALALHQLMQLCVVARYPHSTMSQWDRCGLVHVTRMRPSETRMTECVIQS